MVRISPVLHILSIVIILIGTVMLVPLAVSMSYGDQATRAFVESILLVLAIGFGLWIATRQSARKKELQVRDGFLLAALSWIIVPGVATLPLLLHLPDCSFTDAYFEAVSGLTTTGATVFE